MRPRMKVPLTFAVRLARAKLFPKLEPPLHSAHVMAFSVISDSDGDSQLAASLQSVLGPPPSPGFTGGSGSPSFESTPTSTSGSDMTDRIRERAREVRVDRQELGAFDLTVLQAALGEDIHLVTWDVEQGWSKRSLTRMFQAAFGEVVAVPESKPGEGEPGEGGPRASQRGGWAVLVSRKLYAIKSRP